jgi:hypothetical protein
MENSTVPFVTRDLYLAAALQTLKFPVIDINFQVEKSNFVGYFTFEKTNDLKEAEAQYFRGGLALEPREYVNNMKALKSQVSNATKNPFSDLKP